jgi:AcrR family transcriptional regulator
VKQGRRSDAKRSRDAVLDAAVRSLARGRELDMSRLAAEAGVSRSTLYRHFRGAEAVRHGLLERAAEDAAAALQSVAGGRRPPLAHLRGVLEALAATADRHVLDRAGGGEGIGRVAGELAAAIEPLARRISTLAGFDPPLPPDLIAAAAKELTAAALRSPAPDRDAHQATEALFGSLTEPLDRGLVVLRPDGVAVAANAAALAALGLDSLAPGATLTHPGVEALYEDGSVCPPDSYPFARAVDAGASQSTVVRGHVVDGETLWFSVSARAVGEPPFAVVGVLSDVTAERSSEARELRTPGTLGNIRLATVDVARTLDSVPARLLPEQLVAEARRLVGVPVALYVVDIDGTHLLRLAGVDEFPARMEAPLALGPELAEDGIPDLRRRLGEEVPGAVMAPMWLRGRAVGILLAAGGDEDVLGEVARQSAPAMELANGYTDVFDAARRRKEIDPAAEIQQSLMPPRIVRVGDGQIASGVLPSYDVGGDWVDYVDNRDGAWIAVADAAGRGPRAAALGSIALAALRAGRRNDESVERAVGLMHETICDAAATEGFYVTALVARWSPLYSVFSWVNAGHPPPLLLHADGSDEELWTEPDLPLGLFERTRTFSRSYRQIAPSDRIVLYTDGISARPTRDGLFGRDGIASAARDAGGTSASSIARAIQQAVVGASDRPLRDDAAVTVLAPAL